jgi:predicted dehydrogenase
MGIWGLHHQHPRWYWPLFANLPQLKPLCICDADAAFLAGEEAFFGLPGYGDPAEMLARQDVEAVLIFLPHDEMPEAARRAVTAGKHVLVEKPMGANLAQVRQVAALAAGTKLKVTTGYCWRFDPMARRIRQWIADGLLGEIIHFEGRMTAGGAWRYIRDNAPWMLRAEQAGGPMENLGVHWIDLFHWWTGLEVTAVQGRATRLGGEPERTIEDCAYALLEYGNGATGLLDISYSAPRSFPQGRDLFVSIRGTLGMVNWVPSWGGDDNQVLLVSEHDSVGERKVQAIREPTSKVPGYCGQMGLDYLADFAGAIRAGREVGVPVADGVRATAVAEAALRSAATGCRVEL